jgi:hypothetical protein
VVKSDDLNFREARTLKKEEEMTWKKLWEAGKTLASFPHPVEL